jgi:hypothetical protein
MHRRLMLLLLVVASTSAAANCAQADFVSAFTNVTGGFISGVPSVSGLRSFSFIPTVDVQATSLGALDVNYTLVAPNGFDKPVTVGLFDRTGGGVELGRVVIPVGLAPPLVDNFRYVPLSTPITLAAGRTYQVIALYLIPDTLPPPSDGIRSTGNYTADPRLSNIKFHAINANIGMPFSDLFVFGNLSGAGVASQFGAGMQISAVPEASAFLAVASATLVCGVIARRRSLASK